MSAKPAMRVHTPIQVHDAIMTRLFTYDHDNLTRILSPIAYEWAKKRGIQFAIQEDRRLMFLLPDEMAPYMDWTNLIIANTVAHDVFVNSLEMIQWAGWTTARRKMRQFSMAEWKWIRERFPDQHSWMRTK